MMLIAVRTLMLAVLLIATPSFAVGLDQLQRAQAAERAGNRNEALDAYTQAIQAGDLTAPQLTVAFYRRGVVGQYDLAETDHLAAIDLAKDQKSETYLPWVLQHYADLWRRRGEFDKALALCERALQASSYPSVYFRRAWIYLDMGRPAQAKTEFEKFDAEMKRSGTSYDVFWPDERGAISRLRELR
jgi:tetratricopeptide (TPR) repeat protein